MSETTQLWQLWSYDVWGSEVNDRCCLNRDFELPIDANDEQIRKALVEGGYLKPRFMIDVDGCDDCQIEISLRRNGYPLFGLDCPRTRV